MRPLPGHRVAQLRLQSGAETPVRHLIGCIENLDEIRHLLRVSRTNDAQPAFRQRGRFP